MPTVICVANQKGGIGKTTTATAVASILNEKGHPTLIIDSDLQCNTTDTYRASFEGVETLYDVLLDDKPANINDVIQHTEMGDIVAADPLLREADSKLSFASDGATVVTMCPTCTYTYAYRLMNAPRDITNKHYTELLFDSQFDWDTVFGQLNSMWYGEYGAWLAEVFA